MRGDQRTSVPRGHRWLSRATVLAAVVLAGCGGDDETTPATSSEGASRTSADAGKGNEQFVLKTSVRFPEAEDVSGEVVSGSRLGDSEFCIGTEFRDRVTGGALLIHRVLRCPDGRLTLGFTPDTGPGDGTQTGRWEIVGATGRYTGLDGSGELNVVYTGGADKEGRETFTGTITR